MKALLEVSEASNQPFAHHMLGNDAPNNNIDTNQTDGLIEEKNDSDDKLPNVMDDLLDSEEHSDDIPFTSEMAEAVKRHITTNDLNYFKNIFLDRNNWGLLKRIYKLFQNVYLYSACKINSQDLSAYKDFLISIQENSEFDITREKLESLLDAVKSEASLLFRQEFITLSKEIFKELAWVFRVSESAKAVNPFVHKEIPIIRVASNHLNEKLDEFDKKTFQIKIFFAYDKLTWIMAFSDENGEIFCINLSGVYIHRDVTEQINTTFNFENNKPENKSREDIYIFEASLIKNICEIANQARIVINDIVARYVGCYVNFNFNLDINKQSTLTIVVEKSKSIDECIKSLSLRKTSKSGLPKANNQGFSLVCVTSDNTSREWYLCNQNDNEDEPEFFNFTSYIEYMFKVNSAFDGTYNSHEAITDVLLYSYLDKRISRDISICRIENFFRELITTLKKHNIGCISALKNFIEARYFINCKILERLSKYKKFEDEIVLEVSELKKSYISEKVDVLSYTIAYLKNYIRTRLENIEYIRFTSSFEEITKNFEILNKELNSECQSEDDVSVIFVSSADEIFLISKDKRRGLLAVADVRSYENEYRQLFGFLKGQKKEITFRNDPELYSFIKRKLKLRCTYLVAEKQTIRMLDLTDQIDLDNVSPILRQFSEETRNILIEPNDKKLYFIRIDEKEFIWNGFANPEHITTCYNNIVEATIKDYDLVYNSRKEILNAMGLNFTIRIHIGDSQILLFMFENIIKPFLKKGEDNISAKLHCLLLILERNYSGADSDIIKQIYFFNQIRFLHSDQPIENSSTILHLAVYSDRLAVFDQFIQFGANPLILNADNNSPLSLFLSYGQNLIRIFTDISSPIYLEEVDNFINSISKIYKADGTSILFKDKDGNWKLILFTCTGNRVDIKISLKLQHYLDQCIVLEDSASTISSVHKEVRSMIKGVIYRNNHFYVSTDRSNNNDFCMIFESTLSKTPVSTPVYQIDPPIGILESIGFKRDQSNILPLYITERIKAQMPKFQHYASRLLETSTLQGVNLDELVDALCFDCKENIELRSTYFVVEKMISSVFEILKNNWHTNWEDSQTGWVFYLICVDDHQSNVKARWEILGRHLSNHNSSLGRVIDIPDESRAKSFLANQSLYWQFIFSGIAQSNLREYYNTLHLFNHALGIRFPGPYRLICEMIMGVQKYQVLSPRVKKVLCEARDLFDNSLLHYTVATGHYASLSVLVDNVRCDVSVTNSQGIGPLLSAIEYSKAEHSGIEIVCRLLDKFVDCVLPLEDELIQKLRKNGYLLLLKSINIYYDMLIHYFIIIRDKYDHIYPLINTTYIYFHLLKISAVKIWATELNLDMLIWVLNNLPIFKLDVGLDNELEILAHEGNLKSLINQKMVNNFRVFSKQNSLERDHNSLKKNALIEDNSSDISVRSVSRIPHRQNSQSQNSYGKVVSQLGVSIDRNTQIEENRPETTREIGSEKESSHHIPKLHVDEEDQQKSKGKEELYSSVLKPN